MARERITAEWLDQREACQGRRDAFRNEWPDGATITLTNARRAARRWFDVRWLAYEAFAQCSTASHRYRILENKAWRRWRAVKEALQRPCPRAAAAWLRYMVECAEAFVVVWRSLGARTRRRILEG